VLFQTHGYTTNSRDKSLQNSQEQLAGEGECVVTSIADLMDVWETLVADVSEDITDSKPSWDSGSVRSRIMSRLLELEMREYIGQFSETN
jgi:hypothetical protein